MEHGYAAETSQVLQISNKYHSPLYDYKISINNSNTDDMADITSSGGR